MLINDKGPNGRIARIRDRYNPGDHSTWEDVVPYDPQRSIKSFHIYKDNAICVLYVNTQTGLPDAEFMHFHWSDAEFTPSYSSDENAFSPHKIFSSETILSVKDRISLEFPFQDEAYEVTILKGGMFESDRVRLHYSSPTQVLLF